MKTVAFLLVSVSLFSTFMVPPCRAGGLGGLLDKVKGSSKKDDPKASKAGSEAADIKLPPYTGPKKRIGVMDMEVKIMSTATMDPTATGGVTTTTSTYIPPPTDFGTGLTEMLTTCLVNSGRFLVLERKALMDIQMEQALQVGGSVDPTSMVAQSKLLGAQCLIRGAVTEYTYKRSSIGGDAVIKGLGVATSKCEAAVVLDVRVYDVQTGLILDSQKAEGRAKSSSTAVSLSKNDYDISASGFSQTPLGQATRQAIGGAVKFIVERMERIPWEARVAEVVDEDDGTRNIYVSAGDTMGMKQGLELKILRPGKEIIDPDTRVAIGRTKDKYLGKCKIESVTKSMSIAVSTDGAGYQIGDVVRLLKDTRPTVTPNTPLTEGADGQATNTAQTSDGAATSK